MENNDNIFGSTAWQMIGDDDGPQIESDEIETKNTPSEELRSPNQTIFRINIDKSGSMQKFSDAMQKALELVKSTITTSTEKDKIQIAKTLFSDSVIPDGFTNIEDFNTQYESCEGRTKLYDSIIDSQRRIMEYMQDLKKNGVSARRAILCILSDGIDNASESTLEDAKESIDILKGEEITICFIAFGNDDAKEIASKLGINNVIRTDATVHELHKIMRFISEGTIRVSQGSDN
jgi:uncharacterized protein YegL